MQMQARWWSGRYFKEHAMRTSSSCAATLQARRQLFFEMTSTNRKRRRELLCPISNTTRVFWVSFR